MFSVKWGAMAGVHALPAVQFVYRGSAPQAMRAVHSSPTRTRYQYSLHSARHQEGWRTMTKSAGHTRATAMLPSPSFAQVVQTADQCRQPAGPVARMSPAAARSED